jgi:hypothetical protein
MDNQSNIIFAFLFVAFLVFITMRGELPTYLGFLFGSTGGSTTLGASVGALASRIGVETGSFKNYPFPQGQ